MAITLDGATKIITLDSTAHTAAEIWSRWVDWHPANAQWPLAFSLVGGIALGVLANHVGEIAGVDIGGDGFASDPLAVDEVVVGAHGDGFE